MSLVSVRTAGTALAASHLVSHAVARRVTAISPFQWAEMRQHHYAAVPPPTLLPMNTVVRGHIRCTFSMERICQELSDMAPKYNRNRFAATVFRYRRHKATVMMFGRGRIVCTGVRSYQVAKYCILHLKQRIDAIGYRLIADEFDDAPRAAPYGPHTDDAPFMLYNEEDAARRFESASDHYRRGRHAAGAQPSIGVHVEPRRAVLEEFAKSAFREIYRANVVGTTMFSYADARVPMAVDLDLLQYLCSDIVTYQPGSFPGACIAPPSLNPVRVLVFQSGRCVVTGGQSHEELERALRHIHPLVRMCSAVDAAEFYAYFHANNPTVLTDMRTRITELRERTRPRQRATAAASAIAGGGADEPDDIAVDHLCEQIAELFTESMENPDVRHAEFGGIPDDDYDSGTGADSGTDSPRWRSDSDSDSDYDVDAGADSGTESLGTGMGRPARKRVRNTGE